VSWRSRRALPGYGFRIRLIGTGDRGPGRSGQPQGLQSLGGSIVVVSAALMWAAGPGAFVVRRWLERRTVADAGLRWPRRRYLLLAWFGPPVLTAAATLLSLPIYPIDPSFFPLEAIAERLRQPVAAPALVIAAPSPAFALTLRGSDQCPLRRLRGGVWLARLTPPPAAAVSRPVARGLLLHGGVLCSPLGWLVLMVALAITLGPTAWGETAPPAEVDLAAASHRRLAASLNAH
jgi:hypothetical protein